MYGEYQAMYGEYQAMYGEYQACMGSTKVRGSRTAGIVDSLTKATGPPRSESTSMYMGVPSMYVGVPSMYVGVPSMYGGVPSMYGGVPKRPGHQCHGERHHRIAVSFPVRFGGSTQAPEDTWGTDIRDMSHL